jgi:hypothetical protein
MATKKQENLPKMQFTAHKEERTFQKQTEIFLQKLRHFFSKQIQKISFAKSSLEKICLEKTDSQTASGRVPEKRELDSATAG